VAAFLFSETFTVAFAS